jgi:hypothetical protein
MAFYDTSEYNLRGDLNNGISGSQTAGSVLNAASQPTVAIGGTPSATSRSTFDNFLQHSLAGAQRRQSLRQGIEPPTVMDSRGAGGTFGGVTQPVDPTVGPYYPPEVPPIEGPTKRRAVTPGDRITTDPGGVVPDMGGGAPAGVDPNEWAAYLASPRAPGKPGYVPFDEWKAINATTQTRFGTAGGTRSSADTIEPVTRRRISATATATTNGTGTGTPQGNGNGGTGAGGNATSANGPTYQQFDPNALQMDDVIAQLRTYMDPSNKAAQDQLARQLIHRSAVTGQINSGGDAAVFGDKMGQLINEQNAQLGQMGFAAQQAALDRALQSTKNMNDFELQKWAEANKVMLGKMGIDAQRYATDKGYQAAVVSASAQQAAANASANASMYGDDIRYKLGLVGYDVDRENNLLKNQQFYSGLGLDWAKLMASVSPDSFINGTNTTPGTVYIKP